MAMTRDKMHWTSLPIGSKILPQSDPYFTVDMPLPVTLPKRYFQMVMKNAGENAVVVTPAYSVDGLIWIAIPGGSTTVVAKGEKQISFAVPAAAVYWRIEGSGDTHGIASFVEEDGSHSNYGLP